MTTVVISQPMYLPWPGFFELFAVADVYVHLDDVQLADRGFTNRVQIKTQSGSKWLTIPLANRSERQTINEIEAADDTWRRKHGELIRHALARAPFAREALDLAREVLARERLLDLLAASVEAPAAYLKIAGPKVVVRSSELNVSSKSGSDRILHIVKALGGTRYVTAHGARNYLDHEHFEAAGVAVEYINYSLTPYPQLHGAFTPYVTVLDLIANVGEQAAQYVRPRTRIWRDFLADREPSEAPS
jgi:hypothetical protein